MAIRIISFGYGHGQPPTADLTYDLRALLHNPFDDPALKNLTGLDEAVYEHVMDTPGAAHLAYTAVLTARILSRDTGSDIVMAWGCTGGRHRSVALARKAFDLLQDTGNTDVAVSIEHRDVDKDLLPAGLHNRPRHNDPEPEGDMLLVDLDGGRGGQLPDEAL